MAEGDYVGNWACTAGSTLPTGVTTDGSNIWVCDTAGGDSVDKYAMDGTYINSWNLTAGNSDPNGITTDGSNIWVVDKAGTKVYKYTMAGVYVSEWALNAGNAAPRGIATDGTNIFVTKSSFPSNIYKYAMDGTYIGTIGMGGTWEGMTTDGTHFWFVKDTTDKVYKYTMAGVYVSEWALNAGNAAPRGIATDGFHIWVCNTKWDVDRVYQYVGGGVAATGSSLYFWDGTANVELQRDDASPVQMYNGSEIIGLKLGATDDANASPIHVYDGTTIKAILKMP